MCVICASLKNERQPSEKELRMMFEHNPDGAGYMYVSKGFVYLRKGFMTIDSLLESLRKERFTAKDSVVYHFRISTQAGVKPEMTQPFIVSEKISKTERLFNCGEIGLAHNGIIRMTSNGDKRYSDTALFVSKYATLLLRTRKDNHNPRVHDALNELIGSSNRLAILSADGHIDLVGDWRKYNGLNVSNIFWTFTPKSVEKPKPTIANAPYSYNRYSYKTSYPSAKHEMMERYQAGRTKEHPSIYDRVAMSKALTPKDYDELKNLEDEGFFT